MTTAYFITFAVGAIVGSFLNVCIHRLPRNLSVVLPSSRCPACSAPVRTFDNIPVISFILLRGRCRDCGAKISVRYPLVEILNALLFVLAVWRFGLGVHTPFLFAFCSAMIVITFIDLDFQIIPDAITLPGVVVGLIGGSLVLPDPFDRFSVLGLRESLIGLASGGAVFFLIAEVSYRILRQEAMGGGDIKMMAMVGAFMGWKSVLLTTFSGSLLGSLAGILIMVLKGKGRKTKIPFGPFLAAGALISLFCGQEIASLYLKR
jgi:leader peptidase (prepilin peptidase)/N-methyltransferase